MNRIDDCIAEYKSWCKKLDIVHISDINALIAAGKTDWLINVSEIWQEQKISELAVKIRLNLAKKKLVLISGPSSSGKTSFANRLQLHLKVLGVNAVSISLDDYYFERQDMPLTEEGEPDFEALEAIDYERFNENVADLTSGKEATLPAFDFLAKKRIPNAKTLHLEPDDVIIVEGIHGLNPKLSSALPDDAKHKLYCSALTALSYDSGERIKSRTTRLIRRMIRDNAFRNSTYVETLEMWEGVEKGAAENIYPFTDSADWIFNSSLLYELAAYKEPMLRLFDATPCPEKFRDTVDNIRALLEQFSPIDAKRAPRTSLLREFTGGSTLF